MSTKAPGNVNAATTTWPRGGVNPGTVAKIFTQSAKAAGLPAGLGSHCLRHSYASHLLGAGVSLEFVRRQLGHEEIHELPGQVLEQIERFGPVAPKLREMLSAKDRDATVAVHNAVTVDISKLAPALAEMSWRLFAPPVGREFCTSDSPVLRFNPIDMGPRGNLGILCRGIQVQLALSPDLALLIADPGVYGRDADGVDELNEENLLHYNSLLAGWAHRWLYSRSGDFDVRPGMYRPGARVGVA